MSAEFTPGWELATFDDFMFKPGPQCKVTLKQTGRKCARNKNHKGHHAYRGTKFYVTWERKGAKKWES